MIGEVAPAGWRQLTPSPSEIGRNPRVASHRLPGQNDQARNFCNERTKQ
jgi:hypothetical protein